LLSPCLRETSGVQFLNLFRIQAHLILPLDCRVFLPILEKLRKPVMANQIPDEHVAEFHQTTEKLVESFTTFIR
jgi:hypothetical protein